MAHEQTVDQPGQVGAAQDQWAAVPNLPLLHILPVPGHGPEDVLFLDGSILTGLDDGRIVKVSQDGWQIEVVGDTPGPAAGSGGPPRWPGSGLRRRSRAC